MGRVKPRRKPREPRAGKYYREIFQFPDDMDTAAWARRIRAELNDPDTDRISDLIERWGPLYQQAGYGFPVRAVDWIDTLLQAGVLALPSEVNPGRTATVAELLDPPGTPNGVTTPEELAEATHSLHANGLFEIDDLGGMHAVPEAAWVRGRIPRQAPRQGEGSGAGAVAFMKDPTR